MKVRVLCAVALALALVVAAGWATVTPGPVSGALSSVKASVHGIGGKAGDTPAALEQEFRDAEGSIRVILQYARSSSANRELLTDRLLAELGALKAQFPPQVAIEERLLSTPSWVRGEAPWYGLTVDAHLLLKLADDGPPGVAGRSLRAVVDADEAIARYFAQRCRYERSRSGADLGQEEPLPDMVLSTPGAELAWCCERYMVDAYLNDRFSSVPKAAEVVTAYWTWRKATLLQSGIGDWLPVYYERETMEYAKRLLDTLPAD